MSLDLQKLMDAMNTVSRNTRSQYQLTLKNLIEALEALPTGAVVVCGDAPEQHPGDGASYRGYYSDLSFEPTGAPVTVEAFLAECRSCLGQTFTGYKGGDFRMDDDTPLWIAEYGSAPGRAIMGVRVAGDNAVLEIRQVD